MTDFALHQQLAADTLLIGDLPLSRMLLMNDARYPWVILVPRASGVTELFELSNEDQQQLLKESSQLARFMSAQFQADKMNVAMLGNIVPQLHVHHIARKKDDPAWPGPVWGHSPAISYPGNEAEQIIQHLHQALITDKADH